ncbi:hypothetical protein QBC40DRAFT_318763 [Triangularia verruculosa]|uniref:Protein kinase domain-containing protein n=1 Tax=Triangularia verruculosa TaxID=2587418 RepID=A0AAN7AR78_9PEZI|nr:hypothetical protein QBC40DRAFT_318763 [Triangularia verruculosa]
MQTPYTLVWLAALSCAINQPRKPEMRLASSPVNPTLRYISKYSSPEENTGLEASSPRALRHLRLGQGRYTSENMISLRPVGASSPSAVYLPSGASQYLINRGLTDSMRPSCWLPCPPHSAFLGDGLSVPAGPKIVFHVPAHANPPSPLTTLRSLLLDQAPVCLTSVVKLAKQLVRSVSFVHTCDLVHKNIRPDNILLFPTPHSSQRPLELGEAYLVGFSQFRGINSETGKFGDTAWHRNLYRHPARQGHGILDRYVMQHDIYSLGVCLLEIGIWQSFVWYPYVGGNAGKPGPAPSSSSLNALPGMALRLRNRLSDRDFERAHLPGTTSWIKDDLVLLAKQSLPRRMGLLYTDVVVDCLTCLDRGNDQFGGWDETGEKEDAVVIGVNFVERILGRIEEITI